MLDMSTLGDEADVNPVISSCHTNTLQVLDMSNQVPATHVQRVWQELDYRIDICRVTKGGHIKHL